MSLKELVLEAVERVALPLDEFRRVYAPGSIERTRVVFPTPLEEVQAEMARQIAKWGQQNHVSYTSDGVCNIMPTAETAKKFCDRKAALGTVSWTDILMEEVLEAADEAVAGDMEKLRTELIQCAAVALSWVESIDRNYH